MVLALVFPVLARAFFSLLGLGSAFFETGFLLTRLSILGLICLALPPFLRLRSRAFLRLSLPVFRLAFFGLLWLLLNLACFVLLRLGLPILRLMSLALLRLNWTILRLLRLALLRLN